ncbi:MAG: hypothetical protein HZB41_02915, partial [Ignavibacteriae bacterium]|nr:hypothetical protein [Ignavibacteriota bacterium]
MKFIIGIFLLLSVLSTTLCYDNKDTSRISEIDRILNKLKFSESVKNHYFLELSYGLSLPGFGGSFNTPIVKAFSLDIRYGFLRLDTLFTPPGNYYYASEYTFLRNTSPYLKFDRKKITN